MFKPVFNRVSVLKTLFLIAALGVVGIAYAQLNDKQYTETREAMTVSTGDKIEVVELFWFGCGHCFALEPTLKSWLKRKPENAEFVKVPAIFTSNSWEFHGKAFYTMQALDVPSEAYDAFFNQIHVNRKNVGNLAQLSDFLAAYDKSAEDVESAFNSFAVDSQVRAAKKLTRQSGITGVPAMVVDGKYLTSQRMAGSSDQMFKVVDQLVEKAAGER